MTAAPPPPVFPGQARKSPTGLLVLAALACPLGCLLFIGFTLRGCMTEHSRPVGHGDITFDVSPDGRTVAFAGVGQGRRDLYLLDLETKRVTPLTSSDDYEICPAFSPDGRRLAFTRGAPGVRADQLCVMDLATREVVQITDADENVSSPVFLPDGKRVLCTVETEYRWGGLASSWDEGGELRIVDLETRGQTPIRTPTRPVYSPRISRDGKWIAWIGCEANIAPMANPVQITLGPKTNDLNLSSKGGMIAFTDGEYSPDLKIYTSNRGGNGRRVLSGAKTGCFHPVFSADGTYVYFLSEEWPSGATGSPTRSLMRSTFVNGAVTEIAPSTLFENPLGR